MLSIARLRVIGDMTRRFCRASDRRCALENSDAILIDPVKMSGTSYRLQRLAARRQPLRWRRRRTLQASMALLLVVHRDVVVRLAVSAFSPASECQHLAMTGNRTDGAADDLAVLLLKALDGRVVDPLQRQRVVVG